MAQKPSIPKGTRDFGPAEMAGRNYIFDTIRSVFKTYGYAPIETPSMENLSTLLGKYGEEGDKLLFRILNSGDAFSKINYDDFRVEGTEDGYNSKALSLKVCEKGHQTVGSQLGTVAQPCPQQTQLQQSALQWTLPLQCRPCRTFSKAFR